MEGRSRKRCFGNTSSFLAAALRLQRRWGTNRPHLVLASSMATSLGEEPYFTLPAAETLPKLWAHRTLEGQLPLFASPRCVSQSPKLLLHRKINLSDLVGLVAKDGHCPGTSATNTTTKPTTGASRVTVQAASTSLSFLIDSGFLLTLVKQIHLRSLWCVLQALTSVPSGPPDCSPLLVKPNCPIPLLYIDSVAKFSFSTNSFLKFFFPFQPPKSLLVHWLTLMLHPLCFF